MSQHTLDVFKTACPILSVIADENRQKIMCLLNEHGALNVNQLTDLLHLSRPAVSHHLKLMRDSRLLSVSQVGKERYYSTNMPVVIELLKSILATLEADEAARMINNQN